MKRNRKFDPELNSGLNPKLQNMVKATAAILRKVNRLRLRSPFRLSVMSFGFFTLLLNAVLSIFLSIFIVSSAFPEDAKGFQFKKQPEIQYVKPKKPVKIKLKRTAEGKYTWDLTGDNADEIVRVDKRLRKLLNIE